MIQRIQSVYLLLVAIISTTLVLSDVPFYTETGIPEQVPPQLPSHHHHSAAAAAVALRPLPWPQTPSAAASPLSLSSS